MNLVSVDEASHIVGKTTSMIYLLVKRGVVVKHPAPQIDEYQSKGKGPLYLVDTEEIAEYYKNKTPRDYKTFLNGAVVIDGEEYVTLREASRRLNQIESRVRYIAVNYQVKSTQVTKPSGGEVWHKLFCLAEIEEFNDTINKIVELRKFLHKAKKKQ
jgi:hypothetical protein